MISIFLYRVS